jgi:hypothetical protein
MANIDDSGYDNIVFDEIFFCSVRSLARIKRYGESNPDKIVVATGDTDQTASRTRTTTTNTTTGAWT